MPSRKFIVVFLIILLFAAGIFWFLKYKSQKEASQLVFEKEKDLTPVIFQQNKKDSDNDGLADWEEVLWKTDPNNPDTDGDGTPDGQEVKQGRDPTKAGPNDKYSSESALTASTTPPIDINNETDNLARNFISDYLSYKVAGGANLDQASKDKLVQSLASGVDTQIPASEYTLSDIKTFSDTSKGALQNYSNQFLNILKKYSDPAPTMEIYYFRQMIENKDESMIKELAKSVAIYEGLVKDFLNLPAPQDIKNAHLKMINNFSLLKVICEKFRDYSTDPIGSLVALQQYNTVITDLSDSAKGIEDFLKNKGIEVKFQ